MPCGLFGKLPSKRDFVCYNIGRPFLDMWESWLQTGIAASRDTMGDAWQQTFLSAPIWRFWIGAEIAGTTVAGAMMPSVDLVGRYFPLTLCAQVPPGLRIPPPPDEALDNWFLEVERFLLQMLEDVLPEDPDVLVGSLAMPLTLPDQRLALPLSGRVYEMSTDGNLENIFCALAAEDHCKTHGERSYWWTMGGPQHPAQLLVRSGLPDPAEFTLFIGLTPQSVGLAL
jgi:type VI secretion system protein ImpM